MKKILILVSLVALVASGLFAQVTLKGQVETTVQQTTDGKAPFIFNPDVRVEGDIKADDANTGYFRLRLNNNAILSEAFQTVGVGAGVDLNGDGDATDTYKTVYFDRAYFTTDYLAAFKLGMADLVKVTGQYGLNEWNTASVGNVTSYDTTKRFTHNVGTIWGTAQTVEILKMVKVSFVYDYGTDWGHNYGTKFFVDSVVTVPGVGPGTVKGEVTYITSGQQLKDGSMNFEAAYEMTGLAPGLTLTPAAAYQLTLAEKTNDAVVGAAKLGYDTDLFGAYVDGGVYYQLDQNTDNKTDDFAYIPVAFGASYSKMVGADLGVFLDISKEDTLKPANGGETGVLDSFDGSVWVAAGKAKFRVGYFFVPEKQKAVATREANDRFNVGSAMYFKATLSY
jgi:hypothetical protein